MRKEGVNWAQYFSPKSLLPKISHQMDSSCTFAYFGQNYIHIASIQAVHVSFYRFYFKDTIKRKSEKTVDCVTVFFCRRPAQLGNMINTPMYCLAKHRDQVLCKKNNLATVYNCQKGLFSYGVAGRGGHEAPKSAVCIPTH